MDQLDANNDLDHRAANSTIGQFSFAPATRTTVVTTTTTTTTTFPPLVIKSPRATRDLDPKLYPLASSPTPTSLRNIKFELGGKTVVFNEPEDATVAIKEVNETNNALKASNGFVQSVTSYTTSDNAQTSRRLVSARLSSQPSNPSSAKRRPASVIDSHQSSTRLRPGRLPSEPSCRQIRPHLSSATYTAGLATPETESSSYNLSDYAMPRRRVHSAAIPRRETLLRSPLSSEVESQEVLQDPGAESVLGKEELRALRAKAVIWERDQHISRHRDNASSRPAPQLATPVVNGDRAAGVNTASQGTDYDGSEESFQQAQTEPASQISAIENLVANDMCLPSPSLSPVAALNAMNVDSSFESAEDQEMDTDSSLDNNASRLSNVRHLDDSKTHNLSPSRSGNLPGASEIRHASSLMDIPSVLDFFDSVPEELKTYLMYQFLRRCPKPTLHFVADVVNPALKCDFLALLPLELSLNIVKYFDVQTMCRAAQVSKKWRHIINSDEKTWKDLFDRDGYVLTDGELERAIKEGWGWQFPHGDDDWEKDLSSSAVIKPEPDCAPGPAFSSLPGESGERALSVSRRPKRKATRISGRKFAKRKISSSLRGLHLFKSLYQRHHSIHKGWMKPNVKPKHIAFRAHDRHVVTCLQFDTDKVLTGSDDTNINVYDTKTGALRATLEGHEGGVWALEYHGNTLVSGSTDRSVRVWDIERARCTQIFHGHTSTVRCLQIVLPVQVGTSADGTPEMMPKEPIIITGSRDSSLRVWKLPKPGDPVYYQSGPHADDTDCPYFIRVLTGHQHSVRAIAAHGDTLVSGSYDCTVRVWKISTGETIHRLQGHTLKVYSVVLDHKRNRCISGSMDNTVKVWSLDTGSIIYNLEGHSSLVGLLDLKCDRLVSAAADSTLRIWDPAFSMMARR